VGAAAEGAHNNGNDLNAARALAQRIHRDRRGELEANMMAQM